MFLWNRLPPSSHSTVDKPEGLKGLANLPRNAWKSSLICRAQWLSAVSLKFSSRLHKHSAICSTKTCIDITFVRGYDWVSVNFIYKTGWESGLCQSCTLPYNCPSLGAALSLTWALMWVNAGIQSSCPSRFSFLSFFLARSSKRNAQCMRCPPLLGSSFLWRLDET